MRRAVGRPGLVVLTGTMVAAAPVLAACDSGPSYDEWAATDGAAGRINLEDVQEAFKESEDVRSSSAASTRYTRATESS